MGCFTPYYVHTQNLYVPCGKCYNCRLVKRQAWCFRMQQELTARPTAFFVTFTYDEENVPNKIYDRKHLDSYHTDNFQTLSKEDASELIKTMQCELRRRFKQYVTRKVLVKDAKIGDAIYKEKKFNTALVRYYLIGEYGDKCHVISGTNRPHYHAILYFPQGCSKKIAQDVILSSWSRGIVDIAPVTFADINYVAKHQFKESKGNDYQRKHAPIFATMSRYKGGLGDSYTQFVSRRHPSRNSALYVLLNGYRLALPQFYRKKLFPDKMTDSEMTTFRQKNFDEYGRKFAAAFGITKGDDFFSHSQGEAGLSLYQEYRQLGFSLSNMRWRRYARQKFTRNYVRARVHAQRLKNEFLTQFYNSKRNNVQHIQSQKASA